MIINVVNVIAPFTTFKMLLRARKGTSVFCWIFYKQEAYFDNEVA